MLKNNLLKEMILIVGNGPVEHNAKALVEAGALVIRFNDCRSYLDLPGPTHAVAVCNTGRPGKALVSSPAWIGHPAVQHANEIWCVRDPVRFAAMQDTILERHADLADFCDDYTPGLSDLAVSFDKTLRVFDSALHDAVHADLAVFHPADYVTPSSGMLAIRYVLDRFPDADVIVTGFTHEGWELHPFAAERALVESLVSAGKLRRP